MNEIQQSQNLSDWEQLKRMVPSWMNNKVEPLIQTPEPQQPVWGKAVLPLNIRPGSSDGGGGTPQPGSIVTINGMQVGSTFVPVLITHVEGTIYTTL